MNLIERDFRASGPMHKRNFSFFNHENGLRAPVELALEVSSCLLKLFGHDVGSDFNIYICLDDCVV